MEFVFEDKIINCMDEDILQVVVDNEYGSWFCHSSYSF